MRPDQKQNPSKNTEETKGVNSPSLNRVYLFKRSSSSGERISFSDTSDLSDSEDSFDEEVKKIIKERQFLSNPKETTFSPSEITSLSDSFISPQDQSSIIQHVKKQGVDIDPRDIKVMEVPLKNSLHKIPTIQEALAATMTHNTPPSFLPEITSIKTSQNTKTDEIIYIPEIPEPEKQEIIKKEQNHKDQRIDKETKSFFLLGALAVGAFGAIVLLSSDSKS